MDYFKDELRDKWDMINYRDGGALRLSVDHPLDWYVCYETPEQKAVVALCEKPVANIHSSKSIDTICRERKDGKYAISFILIEQEQEDVFITMAADIIQYSQAENEDKALKQLIDRYNNWRQLLDHKKNAILSSEEQKGLIGELLFLKEQLENSMSPIDVVLGWVGPENADKDFFYEDGWHEIKTTGVASPFVTISSVEQLDSDDVGELVVFRVDQCAPKQKGSFTLYQLIHSIFNMLSDSSEAIDKIKLKLDLVGYIDIEDYDKQHYEFSGKQAYIVDKTFPCLCRQDIPAEILNAKYQISLPSIQQWSK